MGLLQISREANRTSPVFIIGEARSGSSMLYRTLLHHPSFAPRQETLQETSFIRQARWPIPSMPAIPPTCVATCWRTTTPGRRSCRR
jgi:sulfotransferase family protein